MDAIALAVVLALDAAAVAAARSVHGVRPGEAITLALAFGVFQAAMAAIGWFAGASALGWIAAWDHWVAAGILVAIGVAMIVRRADGGLPAPPLSPRVVLGLGVATSLDALAAGITLPLLSVTPWLTIAMIAAVAATLTLLGARAGASLGARFGRKLEIVGGLALCGIGAKILVEHLS